MQNKIKKNRRLLEIQLAIKSLICAIFGHKFHRHIIRKNLKYIGVVKYCERCGITNQKYYYMTIGMEGDKLHDYKSYPA